MSGSVPTAKTLFCSRPANIGFCILTDSVHFGRENWISRDSLHGLLSKTITSFNDVLRNEVLTRVNLLL
jgi:hypothetical protein